MADKIHSYSFGKLARWVPTRIRFYAAGLFVAAVAIFFVLKTLFYAGDMIEAADAAYASAGSNACPLGTRDGTAGRHEMRSADGLPFTVITPRNFQAGYSHPLLVVYAPAGLGPWLSERYAGLTAEATRAGFIVAYVGSLQMSLAAIDRFAAVVPEVEKHWCVDHDRIYATGHSDGGTVATALAILPKYGAPFRSVAVSGAGWEKRDFDSAACGAPLPVLIMHGADDGHFPGFGRDAAAYWSACNRCQNSGKPPASSASDCFAFSGCAAPTIYCEPRRSHWRWAGDPSAIVGFLAQQAAGAKTQGQSR